MGRELPQVPLGREEELEPPAVLGQRLARRDPDRVRPPPARRGRAPGRAARGPGRNACRSASAGRPGVIQWAKGTSRSTAGARFSRAKSSAKGAARSRFSTRPGGTRSSSPRASREQHAAFLERFADRGDLERGERVGAADERSGELGVRRLHPPARKDERAGGEVDLMMAHDHEGLEPRRAVPQEHDGRGGAGRSRARSLRARAPSPSAGSAGSCRSRSSAVPAMNSIARGYL